MHRKRSLLSRANSSRILCASSSSTSASRSLSSLGCKTRTKGAVNHDKARGSNVRPLEVQNGTYRMQEIGTIRASSSYQVTLKAGTSQIHDSRLQNTFSTVSDEELMHMATVEKDELASREMERREREQHERSRISLGEEASSTSRNWNKIPDRRTGKGNPANSKGRPAIARDLEQRTVLLTPWRGAPTFLHAVAFIKELEKRYGRIQWCHLWRDEANPYEYNASIIVIFESPASLRKMPGLSFPNDLSTADYQATLDQDGEQFDMGPSTSLDPTANPATQDMLRRIQVESEKLQQKGKGKASSSIGENPISPLFMPWSEKLDEKALMKGGPSLEDVLAFIQERNPKEKQTVQDENSAESTGVDGPVAQKATWTEYDEPINIDAVIRKWETGQVYLSKPPPQSPYFKASTRLNMAQAFVDFGGFSEEPADGMKAVLRDWQIEIDTAKTGVWMPYDEQALAETEMLGVQEEDSLEQDDHWDLFPVDAWVVDQASTYGRDEEELLPKPVYERIGEDPELDEDQDPWEGLGTHPLQFPNAIKTSKEPKPTAPVSSGTNFTASELLESVQNASKLTTTDTSSAPSKSQPWDTWRTDPRPFRSGLGRDDPTSSTPDSTEQHSKPMTGVRPKPWQWTKPGLGSSTAQQQSAMRAGSHSHSNSVRDWAKDKRGRKMKRREEGALERFGVSEEDLTGGVTPQTESEWDTWGEKEEKAKKDEEKVKAEKDLKARLRAILDGTNVN